jgi:hypothetical protein
MHAETHLVIRLQELDQQIGALVEEISALPKHIAAIEKTLESHVRRLQADKAALAANSRDRKKLEGEIQFHELKVTKLKDQMLEAKTNEQYRAFQHEIEYLEKEIRKAEDRILELMSESEPLEANVKAAESALQQEKQQVEAEKARTRERTAADQAQLEQNQARRKEAAGRLSGGTIGAYERIRKKRNGVAVAEAADGRCSACQIVLRPQYIQDLKKGEQLMFCESCGRILYYNPPASLEGAVAQ